MPASGEPGATFGRVEAAEAIPLADDAVDAVFVGEAFHWFDHERAMAEIRRVSRGVAVLPRRRSTATRGRCIRRARAERPTRLRRRLPASLLVGETGCSSPRAPAVAACSDEERLRGLVRERAAPPRASSCPVLARIDARRELRRTGRRVARGGRKRPGPLPRNGGKRLRAPARALTGDDVWLDRARSTAMRALEQVEEMRAEHGHGRYSLFTGAIGVALFVQSCSEVDWRFPIMNLV